MIFYHKQQKNIESGTVVRIYSPAGTYCNHSFNTVSAYYHASNELVFTACHFDRNKHKGDYYSEFDQPTVEEIRFIASQMLALDWDDGAFLMYPLQISLGYPDFLDLTVKGQPDVFVSDISTFVSFESVLPWSQALAPPNCGGREYQFYDRQIPGEIVARIYSAIDVKNFVLIRGLAAFIKAGMIACHHEIYDAAFYPAFVALDASHQILLEKLRNNGISNPSSKDAARYLSEAFGEDFEGEKYFEEFYDDRIRLMHPNSRFGSYPYVSQSHCDYYQLHHQLREVFRWLILDEVVSVRN